MRATESGQKVIEHVVVGDIDGCQLQTDFVLVAVKQIVVPNGQVEETSGLDALWIVVVLLRIRGRYPYQTGSELCRESGTVWLAGNDDPCGRSRGCAHAVASKARLKLLIRSERQSVQVVYQCNITRWYVGQSYASGILVRRGERARHRLRLTGHKAGH